MRFRFGGAILRAAPPATYDAGVPQLPELRIVCIPLVPLAETPRPRKLGALVGKIKLPDDFDAPQFDVARFDAAQAEALS